MKVFQSHSTKDVAVVDELDAVLRYDDPACRTGRVEICVNMLGP